MAVGEELPQASGGLGNCVRLGDADRVEALGFRVGDELALQPGRVGQKSRSA
jgi:hypothetical protein